MAAPTQNQQYSGGNQYQGPGAQAGPSQAGGYAPDTRSSQSAQGHYGPPPTTPQFDKYCVMHVATTCDEHGVYVTKDSAECIEIGWVVVDARGPNLPEVRFFSKLRSDLETRLLVFACFKWKAR